MGESETREREALEELVASAGWKYFATRCLEETQGLGYRARMSAALMSGDPNDAKVVHRSMLEIERMLKWVLDRIEMLREAE
jgi:hypothetical protein